MRARKVAMIGTGSLFGLIIVAVAAVLAILSTAPGHNFVRERGIRILEKALDGNVDIGSLGGSLWRVADVRDINLSTRDGKSVIRVARARVRFATSDLIRGRFRFVDITLERPVVILEQDTAGGWNFERLFRMGGADSTPNGRRPLVEFVNSRIVDGTLIIRHRPTGSDTIVERTATDLDVVLEHFRASHPDSTGMMARIDELNALVRNPDLDVRNARGSVIMDHDSLLFALDDLRLPGSEAQINAAIHFGRPMTTYGITMAAERIDFADIRGISGTLRFPEGSGSLLIMARRIASGATEVEIANADVRSGRSEITGNIHAVASPSGAFSIRDMNLHLKPLDLALLEPYVDSLPATGLVYGSVSGSGSSGKLGIEADVRWHDERVEGAPPNIVRGRGTLAVGGADQLVFQSFRVVPADLDARTIAAFAPSARIFGRVQLTGELNGPWRHARFAGGLMHYGHSGEASTLRGTMALGLGDTVTLDVDVVADSLSLDLLRRSYPSIPVGGMMRHGRIRLNGPITGFNVFATMGGAVGGLSALGRVGVTDAGAHVELDGTFDSLDLSEYRPAAPPTSLAGGWSVLLDAPFDSTKAPTGILSVSLRPGHIAGVPVQSGGARIRLETGSFVIDTLRVESPGGVITGSGSLGRDAGTSGQVDFAMVSDTLAYLEPLVRWSRARGGDTSQVRLDGSGEVRATVSGSTSSWIAQGTTSFASVRVAGALLRGFRAEGTVNGGGAGMNMSLNASADSVAAGGMGYSAVSMALSGRLDSLGVAASAGLARGSRINAKVSVWGDSVMRVVSMDSVRLDLPVRSWRLSRPAAFAMTEGVMVFDTVEFLPVRGSGRILADGLLPMGGVGDFRIAVESLSVVDLSTLVSRDTSGIGGAIDLTAHISGPSMTPHMEAAIVLQDVRVGDYRAPMAQALLRYDDRVLSLKGGLWRDTLRVVEINGTLPVDLALVSVPLRKLPGPVSIVARSDSADLAVFSPFTTMVRELSGTASLDVSVGGTWENLRYTGFVDIANGAMIVQALGVRYTGMDIRLDLQDQIIRITRGHVGGGPGFMDVAGEIRLPGAASAADTTARLGRSQIDVTINARRFRAFDMPDFGSITATGNLAMRGPLVGNTLTGSITVDEGYLAFADLVQKRVVSLDDPEFRAMLDSTRAIDHDIGPGFQDMFVDSMRIDSLGLTMGPDVWLRSNEANIQLAGDFAVHKTIESEQIRYRLEGTLNAVRGNYRLSFAGIAKDFRVTRGSVRFYGTPDFNPDLEIAAEHTLRTFQNQPLTVRAVIGGTLLFPRLRLESDQRAPLSETEIVSYLVTGAPLGASQGLTSAFAQSLVLGMAGQVGQSLVSELGLPLDYFTIMPGAPVGGGVRGAPQTLLNARIGAGLQLGRRTFLQLTAGLCEVLEAQRLGVAVEYQMRRSLSLHAAVEPLVQECGVASSLSGLSTTSQLSFDFFWQRGLR